MQGKTIILGVSGGIAAYKACELASRLTQLGAAVEVVMSAGAQRFVAPLTFQALTHRPVHTSLWPEQSNTEAGVFAAMAHIGLPDKADAIIIAPASANTIARLAHGLADDLLSTLVLAARIPVLLAPAMNPTMYAHPATRRNLGLLREFGYSVIEPESGRTACEQVGAGRLPATDILIQHLRKAIHCADPSPVHPKAGTLQGSKVLITAGGTRESLDPVRFIGNRSSGKMGFALAAEAAARGGAVMLIAGPSTLPTPPGVLRIDVTTTQEMFNAVSEAAAACAIVIGAAAPADYRPAAPNEHKIKKGGAGLNLQLEETPDIIAAVGNAKRSGQRVIGFAAETGELVGEARRKLNAKHLDAIVANLIGPADSGFDADTNRVTWITPDTVEIWPLMSKTEVAIRIFDALETLPMV